MRKSIVHLLMIFIIAMLLAGCTDNNSGGSAREFDSANLINAISREAGSGTRGAFIELFQIELKGENGTRKDMTTVESVVVSKTDIMMSNIQGDPYAIGYISLGSLNDSVKALTIDGFEAASENIKQGTYTIYRPFNIATNGEPTGVTKDFIDFILSADGQKVVSSESYIAVGDDTNSYSGDKPNGKVVVAGSSSVTPVMEKLKEAYLLVNPNAVIEIQMSDSTSGMTGAIDGVCDIGMASRELKDSEKEKLHYLEMALDGIVMVVNKENPISNLTKENVHAIYTGEVEKWDQLVP